MVEKPNKVQAAMMAGIIFGVVSSIPLVNVVNICCCLWFVIGGAMAARTFINRSTVLPANSGDGAAVGALAGAICAAVLLVLGLPLSLLTSELVIGVIEGVMKNVTDPAARAPFDDYVRQTQGQSTAARLGGEVVQWMITAAVGIGFATLGGVIGVAMFEKRKGQQMPPPPPPPGVYPGYPPPQA